MISKICLSRALFCLAASMPMIVGVAPVIAQEVAAGTRFGEVVDVQLVNVEAWVTDSKGNPVLGLTTDDFELLEDGQPMEITYFSEIGAEKLKAIVESPPQEEKPPLPFTLEPPAEKPNLSPAYLVLYFDQIHLTVPSRKRLIKDVRPFLDSGVVDPERILVLRQEQNLHTEANFGSDRIELEQALARIVKSGTGWYDLSAGETTHCRTSEPAMGRDSQHAHQVGPMRRVCDAAPGRRSSPMRGWPPTEFW